MGIVWVLTRIYNTYKYLYYLTVRKRHVGDGQSARERDDREILSAGRVSHTLSKTAKNPNKCLYMTPQSNGHRVLRVKASETVVTGCEPYMSYVKKPTGVANRRVVYRATGNGWSRRPDVAMSDWPRTIEVTARAPCRFNGFHPRRPGSRNCNRCRFDFWQRNTGKTARIPIFFTGSRGKTLTCNFPVVSGHQPAVERFWRRRDALHTESIVPARLRLWRVRATVGVRRHSLHCCRRRWRFSFANARTTRFFSLLCALTVYLFRVCYRTHNTVHQLVHSNLLPTNSINIAHNGRRCSRCNVSRP